MSAAVREAEVVVVVVEELLDRWNGCSMHRRWCSGVEGCVRHPLYTGPLIRRGQAGKALRHGVRGEKAMAMEVMEIVES